jgi:hypothetical protein
MVIHVLPGDAQVETFKETGIEGEIVVCREAMVEGPVNADDLDAFWQARAEFHSPGDRASYIANVVSEFEQLVNIAPGAEVNLWFEYELFCQANMWFCLYLLKDASVDIYRVEPVLRSDRDKWEGFGGMTPKDLNTCFAKRTKLSAKDVVLGAQLWEAFSKDDNGTLTRLSCTSSDCFPHLREVCGAVTEKDSWPRRVLKEILESGETEFEKIFPIFRDRAGVYGYGDAQVKRILDAI